MARQVDYELTISDEIPEPNRTSGQPSPLESQLDSIVRNSDYHAPRWARIGRYASSVSATAAASTLRGRHGDTPRIEGWRFETRRIENGEATGLFAQYDEGAIVDGAYDEWLQKRKDRAERLTEARRQRAASKVDSVHTTAQGMARSDV
jgi:hypothetical protein